MHQHDNRHFGDIELIIDEGNLQTSVWVEPALCRSAGRPPHMKVLVFNGNSNPQLLLFLFHAISSTEFITSVLKKKTCHTFHFIQDKTDISNKRLTTHFNIDNKYK